MKKERLKKALREKVEENTERFLPEEGAFSSEEMDLPLFEEEDEVLLAHKKAHFSDTYEVMKEYYKNPEAKGICEEIYPDRIAQLQKIEEQYKIPLSSYLLSSEKQSRIDTFSRMRDAFESIIEEDPVSFEGKLCEAILSEEYVEDLVEKWSEDFIENPKILLEIAQSELLQDPLSPGYGQAPVLAILLLGKAKYEEAIPAFFSMIGKADFFVENAVLWALSQMGQAALAFAKKKLVSHPISLENEKAALVLLEFPKSEEISSLAKRLLDSANLSPSLKEYVQLLV